MATRITSRTVFSVTLNRAVEDYRRQEGDVEWSEANKKEMAKSAAIQCGLSYEGNEVDAKIVEAIVFLHDQFEASEAVQNQRLPEERRIIEEAWAAYRNHL